MFQDYYARLQDLQKDKNNFLKMKFKSNTKEALGKQENKYHKYILEQITYKNKLDSLFLLNNVFQNIFRKQIKNSFKQIYQKNRKIPLSQKDIYQAKNQISFSTMNTKSTKSVSDRDRQSDIKNWIKNISLASCKLIFKLFENRQYQNIKSSLNNIKNYSQKVQKINILVNKIQIKSIQNKKHFIQQLHKINRQNLLAKDKMIQTKQNPQNSLIFSLNQFSEIIAYTIQQQYQENTMSNAKNIKQIDDKFKLLISSNNIKASNNYKNEQIKINMQNSQKLKQEIILMKNILNEKNKQIKSKDEEIYRIKKQYQNKIEKLHDQFSQKIQRQFNQESRVSSHNISRVLRSKDNNQSYLIEMQQILMGDRQSKNKNNQQNVSDQLLQKYMKQSFEMREKMDMAREMCEQFQFDSRTEEGLIMIQIIKLLTPESRLNVYVD